MAFTHPVYIDSEHLLVPENIEIRTKDIARLEKWGVQEVQTEGNPIKKVKTKELPPSAADFCIVESKQVHSLYHSALVSLKTLFLDLLKKQPTAPKSFADIVGELLPQVGKFGEDWLNYGLSANRNKDYLIQSSLNTMIYSLVIGYKLNFSHETLSQLGLAALLHDVGMQWVPGEIRAKTKKLEHRELKAIKLHPLYTYKVITEKLRHPLEVAEIAMGHHERWDGQGYPSRLSGEKIPLSMRILSLADAFEAMMWDRPYRKSLLGNKAIRQIISDNSRRFDTKIVKIFVQCLGIYPVGSFVSLNNGAIGLVVKTHPVAPLRPMVRILLTEEGKRLKKNQRVFLDLLQSQNTFIVRSFNPKAEKEFAM